MTWRKGCLCGCLYEEECAYRETPAPPTQVVHVVHHVIHHAHHDPPADVIEGEYLEIESSI